MKVYILLIVFGGFIDNTQTIEFHNQQDCINAGNRINHELSDVSRRGKRTYNSQYFCLEKTLNKEQ